MSGSSLAALRLAGAGLVLLVACANVTAQHVIDSWTTENGLPQNSVNDILQTRDGYVWMATHGGLVRFDGARFVVFDRSVAGIESQRLRALHEDRMGTLWAASEDGMLIRHRAGRFTTYATKDGLPHAVAARIEEDDEGNLWVTWVGHVTKYDGTRLTTYTPKDFGNRVSAPPPDRYLDAWWSEDAGGLHVLVKGHVQTYSIRGAVGSARITGVGIDRRGNVWVSTHGAGVIKAEGGRVVRYTTAEGLPSDQPSGVFSEGREGEVWYAHPDAAYRLRNGKFEKVALPATPLPGIRSLYVDNEGSTWIGTLASGVHRLNDVPITLYDERDGVSLRIAYALLEDRSGAIWISTGTLRRFANGRFTLFRPPDGTATELVTSLYEDRAGTLWVGTAGGLRSVQHGQLRRYEDPSGFLRGSIWAIVQDRAGTFWFATEGGLVKSRGDQFTRYTTADGLAHDRVGALFEDRSGALWIGTFRGLTRSQGGAFTSYTERDGFIGNGVRAFHEDSDGILWIGTYDGGLYRLANNRLTRYTRAEGLHDNGVFQILEDDHGYLWMGSNRGIQRVSRRELNEFAEGRRHSIVSLALGTKDGLASVEVNGGRQPAGLKTSDGRLWFPTMGGVAVVDPSRFKSGVPPPPTIIEEFRLAGAPSDFSGGIEVGPDSHVFEIRYTAPSFVRPEQVRFRHRLLGLQDEWIDAGDRREVAFYSVPPGRYTFEVVAAGHDGVWHTTAASLAIVVLPPFWRTWWFVSLTVATAVSIALAAHGGRVRHLRRLHALHEAFSRRLIDSQENERRRISNEMHDSLGQDLRIIKKLVRSSEAGRTAAAPASEVFDEIATVTEKIQRDITEIAYGLRPHQLDNLGLSKTIESMIRRVERTCDIRFVVDIAVIDDVLPEGSHIHVFRIVQEGISNIIEHANATSAQVVVARHPRHVSIEVADNGRGFTVANPPAPGSNGGVGLMGIRERVKMLGGRVEIHTSPQTGTTLRVTLPLDGPAHG